MSFSLKTEVFKSLVFYLSILLFYSCDSSKEKQLKKQNKVETPLTNNKDESSEQSNEDLDSKQNIPIESKIEIDQVEKNEPSLSEKKKIEKVEISNTSKSINQNKQVTNTNKYSRNPFSGKGGINPPNEPGRDHGGGSASCYGGEIRFYDKDTISLKRYYVSMPNTSSIKNEEFCKISFKVSVDSNGNIISARVNSSGTTTTNQELINQVREIVKSELKYNKVDPKTQVFSDIITITIQPN